MATGMEKKKKEREREFLQPASKLHAPATSKASGLPTTHANLGNRVCLQASTVGFGFTFACYNSCSLYYTFLFLDSGLRKLPLSSDEGWVC